jgi:predicted transcriptional regulator
MIKKVLDKPTILQLNEYDVNQRIIEALTNVCSHAVLFSIVNKAKDAEKISDELQMSISNVYKTLMNLEKLTLIEIERFVVTNTGKKIKLYRSRIKKAKISVEGINSKVELVNNENIHQKISAN